MPFVDLVCPGDSGDLVSLWYRTNTTGNYVSAFDPEKPTIMMLHPYYLDSSWLRLQMDDPRIGRSYNIIAFDSRCSGKTISRPTGWHDIWVEAADLAFAHQKLHLPPCHIYAAEGVATYCAIRLAALFPEICLSLTLCSVPPPSPLTWVLNASDDMLRDWAFAEDLNVMENTAKEWVTYLIGEDCDVDLMDELVGHFETAYPPTRRSRLMEYQNLVYSRNILEENALEAITQPTLIIQGQRNVINPLEHAEKLVSDLCNIEGGARLYTVKGAMGYLSIVPSAASIANQTFAKFLSRLPHARSELRKPALPLEERMTLALLKLAEFRGDDSIAARNPLSPLSFSCVPPEVAKQQFQSILMYAKGQDKAFSPLGPSGRPKRKYSERLADQWHGVEANGMSYVGSRSTFSGLDRSPALRDASDDTTGGDAREHTDGGANGAGGNAAMPGGAGAAAPASGDLITLGRVRRATYVPTVHSSIERVAVRGTMKKMVATTAVATLRL